MAGKIAIVRHEAHTGLTATYSAAAAVGAAVKVTGSKTVGPTTAATDIAIGVSHHAITAQDITDGNKGTIRLKGDMIPMTSSAAIAAGAKVEVAASGKVATQSTGAVFGIAWTAASGADQEILVIVL